MSHLVWNLIDPLLERLSGKNQTNCYALNVSIFCDMLEVKIRLMLSRSLLIIIFKNMNHICFLPLTRELTFYNARFENYL